MVHTPEAFNQEVHLAQDRLGQAIDDEIVRLRAENQKIQRMIERLMLARAEVRKVFEPICGLPRLQLDDDDPEIRRIASQMAGGPQAPEKRRRLALPTRQEPAA